MKWIKAKQQMPKPHQRVLAMMSDGRIFAAYIDKKSVWSPSDYGMSPINGIRGDEKVEYWMEIPDEYEMS